MDNPIHGLQDMYTVISNERKIGGVIEADEIKLRSGETFQSPVFTNIDYSGSTFYTVSFISDKGTTMLIHVNDISTIKSLAHKRVQNINNQYYKEMKTKEKINYLKRLCKADQGACTKPFMEEVNRIIEDIGSKSIQGEDISIGIFKKAENNVFKIA
ncbi:MAG: hypothetical protein LRY73_08340 [Bacillus sp. (in: Bacteria)]|nr:hypothetical protein [Bacillus sp. (in: firmicutes)]